MNLKIPSNALFMTESAREEFKLSPNMLSTTYQLQIGTMRHVSTRAQTDIIKTNLKQYLEGSHALLT